MARINNVGVFIEVFATLGLIGLLTWFARRGPAVVFETAGRGDGSVFGYLFGPALAASLTATFVLYGFDTAGSLAEETDDLPFVDDEGDVVEGVDAAVVLLDRGHADEFGHGLRFLPGGGVRATSGATSCRG